MARRRRTQFENWAPSQAADSKTVAGKAAAAGMGDVNLAAGEHFATRERVNEFVRLMRTLPDPDPILKKMGKGVTALRELLTDAHLESVWGMRCAVTSGGEWFVSPGAEGKREQEAADAFRGELEKLDVPRIIEEMMDAVAYGFSPLEILWKAEEGRWSISDLVGKPPHWFEYDQRNRLVIRTGALTEEVPENRFLVVNHRASYANPYGDKVFSKCFWPVTFKKNGFRWWTVFVEKYGGAFLWGKYPNNAGEAFKGELLESLQKMVADAVAIVPEGSDISIESIGNKGSVSAVHSAYIQMANAEISKAVLGQTLTTEIGEKGSYAAAQAHNLVREDLAAADRRRICAAFNRLSAVYTFYNFGADVAAPRFEFVRDEDLQADRAERDVKLYQAGVRFRKSYVTREYEIPEEDFELADGAEGGRSDMARLSRPARPTGFLRSFFASASERRRKKDERLMAEFAGIMAEKGQEEIDRAIEAYVDALGTVDDYKEAPGALAAALAGRDLSPLAGVVDNVRFAAAGIGYAHGGK